MSKYLKLLILLLVVKAVIVVNLILKYIIGLGPDEAQYWTWSQTLAPGYYSKPPGIAWQIALGTVFFGSTEFGVRIVSVLLSFLTALAVYFLAKTCRLRDETAFWSGVLMAFIPLGVLGSFLAITDVGMIFFWVLASIVFVQGLAERRPPNYTLLGFVILLGALFKWPIYFFWTVTLLLIPFYPFVLSATLPLGIAISLLGLMPSIFWNATHDWATFLHVGTTLAGGHQSDLGATPLHKGNFWEFIGAQAALISPLLFILLLLTFSRLRTKSKPALFFCGVTTLFFLLGAGILSPFQKLQGNWCTFAYPTGLVFLAYNVFEERRRLIPWFYGGLSLSIVMLSFVLAIPWLQTHNLPESLPIPYKLNTFKHNVGWDALTEQLHKAGYDPQKHFLFADKYQTVSILSFYGPEQKRAYFFNLHGLRKNQFSYWPGMPEEQQGKTGFFILIENAPHLQKMAQEQESYEVLLKSYFDLVGFKGSFPLFTANGTIVKAANIFECSSYNGKVPTAPEHY